MATGRCSSRLGDVASCFTRPPAPHMPIFRSRTIGETWPIRSKRFRSWLRRCHYEATGEAASPVASRSALDLLEVRAIRWPLERAVYMRTAEHAGRIYLDL